MSSSNSDSSSLSSSSSDCRHYQNDVSSNKQLSFFNLRAKFPPPEPPGTMTPPLETSASVPFRWEEAPGKPRASNDTKGDRNDKRLELPPRLLADRHVCSNRQHGKIASTPSPTTVLDGPDAARSLAYGLSFRSFRSPERFVRRERAGYFASSRWGGSLRKDLVVDNNVDFLGVEGSNDFSASHVFDGGATHDCGGEDVGKVKTAQVKKGTKSRLWGSIYGSIKQAVPWKRRERSRK